MSEQRMTAAQMIADWDAGRTVWTLGMGGLGPGYEQAIQILMMEILRDRADTDTSQLPPEDWADETVARCDQACLGFSGAQVGAAKQLAWAFLKHGPEGFWEFLGGEAPERSRDRIQVSKSFPSAPPVEVAA